MFIHPVDTAEILKTLRKTTTQVQSQIHIEEQSGKVRDPMLETALNDIEYETDLCRVRKNFSGSVFI